MEHRPGRNTNPNRRNNTHRLTEAVGVPHHPHHHPHHHPQRRPRDAPNHTSHLGQHLPWVATQQISTHWLRHTTLTWVERNFGYAVARAYAGHDGKNDAGTTTTYVRADVYEVACALAALTGEPHPLALSPGRD